MSNKKLQAGFTLIELLVVIAIIAILAAILFPVFAQAREKARQISCLSNEDQVGLAMIQYEQDYDEALVKEFYAFPPNQNWGAPGAGAENYSWRQAIQPYMKDLDALNCPDSEFTNPKYYNAQYPQHNGAPNPNPVWSPAAQAVNSWVIGFANGLDVGFTPPGLDQLSQIDAPANTIVITDSRTGWNDVKELMVGYTLTGPTLSTNDFGSFRCRQVGANPACSAAQTNAIFPASDGVFTQHQHLVNFIFADGHAKSMKLGNTVGPAGTQKDLWDCETQTVAGVPGVGKYANNANYWAVSGMQSCTQANVNTWLSTMPAEYQ